MNVFLIFLSMIVMGCTTIPPKEVHSAAGISRSTIVDVNPHGQVPRRFAGGMGISGGVGNRDDGTPASSTNIEADGEVRIVDRLAVGLQPYFSTVDGSFDSASDFGITFYGRWKFMDSGHWTLSLYPGISYSKNSAESDGQYCGLFGCANDGQSSQSHVEVIDPRIGLITSFYVSDRNVLSLIPTLYYSHEDGSFSDSNVEQFVGSRTGLEYSAVLSYGHIFDIQGGHAMIQLSAGAGTHRGFGNSFSDQRIDPLIQLGLQLSLGKEIQ